MARALDTLGRHNEAVSESTMGIAGLLLGNAASGLARSVVEQTLAPLLAHDAKHQTKLVVTAAAFLDANGSISKCAATLHYHPNTVRQRLDRIDHLLGADWREGPRALDVHLALRLSQFLDKKRDLIGT
jgi:DNA-binding PucR family transcriptional regulator